jgi:hypothetical protein
LAGGVVARSREKYFFDIQWVSAGLRSKMASGKKC